MTSGGAEALKAAIRRSLPIIIGLTVLGIVAVNVFYRVKGPVYQATSRVEVSTTPLSSIITGTQPAFVDPQRSQDTALALAQSPQLYLVAAQQGLGSASRLKAATSAAEVPDTDIISFSTKSSNPKRAIAIANGVASAFVSFRAQLSASQITQTISKLQTLLPTLPAGSVRRAQTQNELSRLQVLQGVNSSDASVVQSATSATKTSPAAVKDSLLGLSLGLVIALLVVALREAVDTTVRSEGDVEDLLSAPVLATVRTLPRRARIVTYGRYEAMFGDTYALLAAQLSPGKNGRDTLVLAVTSAVAREGKTTTAANLAVAAARRGANVLLADFDFRKSALSDLFEIPHDAAGALQVLDGAEELEDVLWSVSLEGPRPIVSPNGSAGAPLSDPPVERSFGSNGHGDKTNGVLRILPSGGVVSSHHAARQSQLRPLLQRLDARAELVILDTPPALLTVEMTELAELIDVVLVVVRQGRISQRSLRSLSRQARGWSAELAGAVLTDAPSVGEYGSYYYGAR
jgi:non-specific protein-tyrosine kinase